MLKLLFLPLGSLSQAFRGEAPLGAIPSAAAAHEVSLLKEKRAADEGSKRRAGESVSRVVLVSGPGPFAGGLFFTSESYEASSSVLQANTTFFFKLI